ncbi:UDP-glycosyltransferase 73C4-like [Andrographis paniculata]|uniref:Glycosyltransferase n=1 Tax=Andrographis paniculata TaxID=175694 RepID=A0A3G1S3S5_ANDPA|nr:UDP-glycosyltransferase 73C4-like [Andrographis paniculata]AXL95242.1 UDP-glycosyltransferase [Andrographis paniculata]
MAPNFVLFPYMAQGHTIPMVDIGRLLAARGVTVTIISTPVNSRRISPVIDRAAASGLPIRVAIVEYPSTKVGLPEGCENYDMLPEASDVIRFLHGTTLMKDDVRNLLKELRPACLISDMLLSWTAEMALDLGIPRLIFHGTSCFAHVMWNVLETSKAVEAVASNTEYFIMPELPDNVPITKAQIRGTPGELPPDWDKLQREFFDAEKKSFGTVANTFEELELKYVEHYLKTSAKRVWCIGPVSLCNDDELDKAERGNKAVIDEHECLKWLDSQDRDSVIFVCLGTLSRVASSQLIELGLALESSGRPFIWVVKSASDEFKSWLSEENFEGRVKGRGLVIRGWAPQLLILSHASVGGFLTHCGWNSTLEGISAGLPMATWPVFAEQFINEKFVVYVAKTGVRVGVEMPVMAGEEEAAGVQVKMEEIKMAIDEMMDGGDEGKERRERARKLGEMAKMAMAGGGSSYANMTRLIREVQEVEE